MSEQTTFDLEPPAGRFDDSDGEPVDPPETNVRRMRSRVQLTTDLPSAVEESIAALARYGQVYSRAGALVGVSRETDSPSGVVRASGTASVKPIAAPLLLVHLMRAARYERWDTKAREWVGCKPTSDVVAAVHCSHAWPGVRELSGVLEAPALRPDGTVIQEPGYDASTGYLYEPSADFPRVADAPSQADAARAAISLLEVVQDFPFASEAHRSAWLAFLLTLFARPAIAGCVPLMAIDATTRGTGKTRLADVTAILATGRPATKTPLPAEDEELRKRLTALVVEAEQLACLDNVAVPISFPSLDAALTATTWKDRMLGSTAMVSAPNRLVLCVTGNNLAFGADTSRRALHIRLESLLENPEDRDDYAHADLLGWASTNRPRLVVAALTILRGYAAAGMPSEVKPWGSFEDWSRVVAGAVVWAGMPDPQSTRGGLEATSDLSKNALANLIEGWAKLAGPEGMTAKMAIAALYPSQRDAGPPDGHDELREAIESLVPTQPGKPPSVARVGYVLRSFRRRVVGGRMLDAAMGHAKTLRWRVCAVTAFNGGDVR